MGLKSLHLPSTSHHRHPLSSADLSAKKTIEILNPISYFTKPKTSLILQSGIQISFVLINNQDLVVP